MPELFGLVQAMMRRDPARRLSVEGVWGHAVVVRARARMAAEGSRPLDTPSGGFLRDILGHT